VPAGYQTAQPVDSRYATTSGSRLYPVPAGTVSYSGACYVPQTSCQPYHDLPVRQGYLRKAGRSLDFKPTYALETSQRQILAYVTAQPGVNLEQYENKNVEVAGQMCWRGDVRANFMAVSRVTPLK
jgi:hypothetical protein